MDSIVYFGKLIIKICVDIIIIGGAIFIVLLILLLVKLKRIVFKLSEIVDDIYETYFKFRYFVSYPFKYINSILNLISKKKKGA